MKDDINYLISSAAITTYAWEDLFRELDAYILQLLGVVWLSVQIFYKIKNKGK